MQSQQPESAELNALLLKDIINLFSVSKEFVLEYRNLCPTFDWSKKTWYEFLESLTPLNQMYVYFVMSTVLRGRDFFSLLNMYNGIRFKNRYLDIGTAYAGFLYAFKEQGFKEVIGIELQEHLAQLGNEIIRGMPEARIIVGDFLQNDYSSLGTFDVVTCNDVIEHVDDAAFALQKMSGMVGKDGCLALEVPNKDCIRFVKSDGHFQLFGLTQFSKNDAADYYARISQINSGSLNSETLDAHRKRYLFEMGEMYELGWYIEKLSNNGMSVVVADTHRIGDIKDVATLCSELKNEYAEWDRNIAPHLERDIAEKLKTSMDAYIFQLESDFTHINDEDSRKRFKDKYLRSFWTLIAFKEKNRIRVPRKAEKILLWNPARALQFFRQFVHNPRQAVIDLLKFLKLR